MSSCRLMFPGVRSFLMLSSFGIKSPACGFQSSRLLHPYSTEDKTSWLMVKQLFIARDTQRFPELHEEEKREERDRGDQEEKRGNQNGRDKSSQ